MISEYGIDILYDDEVIVKISNNGLAIMEYIESRYGPVSWSVLYCEIEGVDII